MKIKTDVENENKVFYQSKQEFERLREIHLNRYLQDKQRMEILKTTNEDCLRILDEMMKSFIEKQLQILTFKKNGTESVVLGLSSHLHRISAVKNQQSNYPKKCFTTFLRSDFFAEKILERGFCSPKIPTAFLEYIAKYHMEHKNKQELLEERDINKEMKRINFNFLKQKTQIEKESFNNDNVCDGIF